MTSDNNIWQPYTGGLQPNWQTGDTTGGGYYNSLPWENPYVDEVFQGEVLRKEIPIQNSDWDPDTN